jgi:hypothetical protein
MHYGDRVSVPMVGGLQQLVAGGDLGQQLADAKSGLKAWNAG